MAQGKKLTPEIQWAIVRLSRMLNNDQIAIGLGISPRSVRWVISYFYEHGTVPSDGEKPAETEVVGNRRLDEANVERTQTPGLYLDELQGVEVSRPLCRPYGFSAPGTQYGGYPVPVYIHMPPFNYIPPTSGSSIPAFPSSGSSNPTGQQPSGPIPPSISTVPSPGLPPLNYSDTPNVSKWFSYLDGHQARNNKGIAFAPIGPILEGHGFEYIAELISEFLPADALAKLLNIKRCTAIDILQYVQSDLNDITSGKLVFPK